MAPYNLEQNTKESTLINIDLFDYFLFVEHIKIELGNSMFPRLEISETNKLCEFKLFPWQQEDFKMALFLHSYLNISCFVR